MAEFLGKCGTEYKTLLQNRSSGLETVVVPTSEHRPINSSGAHGGNAASSKSENTSDGVDSSQYTRAVLSFCDRISCSCVSFSTTVGLVAFFILNWVICGLLGWEVSSSSAVVGTG